MAVYFWIMMTVIYIEKLTSLPLVNVFLRENADCYVVMAFRSFSFRVISLPSLTTTVAAASAIYLTLHHILECREMALLL